MNAKDLRTKSAKEMGKLEQELSEELFKLQIQKRTGQLTGVARLGQVRKDIARIKTIKNEASVAGAKGE